jgi:ferredoxin, 2Fe-2S
VIRVTFSRNGVDYVTHLKEGDTLLDGALKLKLPEIPAICGGNCACGTCHVYLNDKWVDKVESPLTNSPEIDILKDKKSFDNRRSRLCCQIKIKKEYDGLQVRLLADELL